jgi:hypothetical protein
MMAGSLYPIAAMNGKAVVIIQRQTGWDWENTRTNYLVIASIVNNEVTANDTILRNGSERISAPQFSFDAQKVAFARDVTIGGQKRVAVSIIDIDGKNLRNIGYIPGQTNINHMTREWIIVDWPKGNWVYYANGGEGGSTDQTPCAVWRVNVNDTASKFLAANYGADVGRFSLSANGLYCAADVYRSPFFSANGPRLHRFPSLNTDATLMWDNPNLTAVLASNYCNTAMAPSGTVMFHFAGTHNKIDFCFWDHATDKVIDNNQVLGSSSPCTQPNGPGGVCWLEIDKWLSLESHSIFDFNTNSTNSDRWVLTQVWWGAAHNDGASFGIAVGWKDRDAILLANIPKSEYSDNADKKTFWTVPPHFGDLWADGGTAAAGKLQDTTGAWVDVDPVGTLVDFHAVSNRLTMVCSPRNAIIYYTIDGSDPTTSSARYTGPLTYTSSNTTHTVKVRAFADQMPTGLTVTKTYQGSLPTGVVATVPRGSANTATQSNYVVYDLLGNRITHGMGNLTATSLARGMYLARETPNGRSVTSKLSVLSAQQGMKFVR